MKWHATLSTRAKKKKDETKIVKFGVLLSLVYKSMEGGGVTVFLSFFDLQIPTGKKGFKVKLA